MRAGEEGGQVLIFFEGAFGKLFGLADLQFPVI